MLELIHHFRWKVLILLSTVLLLPAGHALSQEAPQHVLLENSNGRLVCEIGETPSVKLRKSLRSISIKQLRVRTKARIEALSADPGKTSRFQKLRGLLKEIRQCLRGEGRFSHDGDTENDEEEQPPTDGPPTITSTPTPTPTPSATPTPQRTPPPAIEADRSIVVQPFNYYYPDMPVASHEVLEHEIALDLPRGQVGYATFLYEAAYDREEVIVRTSDLHDQEGRVLSRDMIKVGVVEIVDQYRSISTYLQNIWLRGHYLEETADRRRVQEKVNANPGQAPIPFLVVPNHNDFQALNAGTPGPLVLPKRDEASSPVPVGQRRQFWITVTIPEQFSVASPASVFEGALELEIDGASRALDMRITVHNFELDTLALHDKSFGIYRAVTELPTPFRDSALDDLKAHNVNMIVDSGIYPADFDRLRAAGYDDVVSLSGGLSTSEINYVRSLGISKFAYYTRDEPEYLVDDPNSGTDGWDIFLSRYNLISQNGLNSATAGLYAPTDDWFFWDYPHDWYAMSFRMSWNSNHPTMLYLDSLGSNPFARIASRQGHYSATLSERYYLMTRLLYGPWLALSNLDFGAPYGYAPNVQTTDLLAHTSWDGVAYPVRFTNPDGSTASYEMLSNQVWDAFGDAGKMFRMVLTARRLANQVGTSEHRDRFEALVAPYRHLFPPNQRLDTINFNSDLDELQRGLLALIGELYHPANP